MSDDSELKQARERIDALDRRLQELLTERAALAVEVAEIKRRGNPDTQFYRPEREAQILREVARRNQGPLSDETLTRLFREIISACQSCWNSRENSNE